MPTRQNIHEHRQVVYSPKYSDRRTMTEGVVSEMSPFVHRYSAFSEQSIPLRIAVSPWLLGAIGLSWGFLFVDLYWMLLDGVSTSLRGWIMYVFCYMPSIALSVALGVAYLVFFLKEYLQWQVL